MRKAAPAGKTSLRLTFRRVVAIGILTGLTIGVLAEGTITRAFNFEPVAAELKEKYADLTDVKSIVNKYNEAQNDYLNLRILALVSPESMTEEEAKKINPYLPPVDENDLRDDCPKDKINTTTLCIAREMTDEFFAFKERLRSPEVGGAILNEAQVEIAKEQAEAKEEGRPFSDFLGYAEESAEQLNLIEREVDVAERTLELSIASYNELHMAYPLHLKYGELIKALELYRDELTDLRDEITFYPVSFTNVSTTACK